MSGFFLKFVVGCIALLLPAGGAMAATQAMTANISFDAPLSLTKISDIQFGSVQSGLANTYTITPSGVVSAANGSPYLHGATSAGSVTVSGSATQAINVSVGNYTADGGVTLQNAVCSYDGGSAAPCTLTGAAPPAAGKTLNVGVQAIVDGTQAAGTTAAPGFTVTILYP